MLEFVRYDGYACFPFLCKLNVFACHACLLCLLPVLMFACDGCIFFCLLAKLLAKLMLTHNSCVWSLWLCFLAMLVFGQNAMLMFGLPCLSLLACYAFWFFDFACHACLLCLVAMLVFASHAYVCSQCWLFLFAILCLLVIVVYAYVYPQCLSYAAMLAVVLYG